MLLRRRAVAALLVTGSAVAAPLQGAAAAGSSRPAGATVVLRDVAFSPAVTRIRAGQRVTWTWNDPYVTHNVKSVGRPRFAGASARLTGRHAVRFTRGGVYRYTCTLHPGMNGRIVVR